MYGKIFDISTKTSFITTDEQLFMFPLVFFMNYF